MPPFRDPWPVAWDVSQPQPWIRQDHRQQRLQEVDRSIPRRGGMGDGSVRGGSGVLCVVWAQAVICLITEAKDWFLFSLTFTLTLHICPKRGGTCRYLDWELDWAGFELYLWHCFVLWKLFAEDVQYCVQRTGKEGYRAPRYARRVYDWWSELDYVLFLIFGVFLFFWNSTDTLLSIHSV